MPAKQKGKLFAAKARGCVVIARDFSQSAGNLANDHITGWMAKPIINRF